MPCPTGYGDWKAETVNGLVAAGELARVASGPAWMRGRVARLRHKAETIEPMDFISGDDECLLGVQLKLKYVT